MNTWQSSVLVLATLAWLAAPPRSLGEAAQREAMRRKVTPKSHVSLTNQGLPSEVPAGVVTPPDPPPADPAKPDPNKKDEPKKDEPKKDEQWWRKRIGDAREALAKHQAQVETLQLRINGLHRDFLEAPGGPKFDQIRAELNKTIAEQEVAKRLVQADMKDIADIQESARRENVPAGWVR